MLKWQCRALQLIMTSFTEPALQHSSLQQDKTSRAAGERVGAQHADILYRPSVLHVFKHLNTGADLIHEHDVVLLSYNIKA